MVGKSLVVGTVLWGASACSGSNSESVSEANLEGSADSLPGPMLGATYRSGELSITVLELADRSRARIELAGSSEPPREILATKGTLGWTAALTGTCALTLSEFSGEGLRLSLARPCGAVPWSGTFRVDRTFRPNQDYALTARDKSGGFRLGGFRLISQEPAVARVWLGDAGHLTARELRSRGEGTGRYYFADGTCEVNVYPSTEQVVVLGDSSCKTQYAGRYLAPSRWRQYFGQDAVVDPPKAP